MHIGVALAALLFCAAAAAAADDKVERGKYLVEEVAKCADCHTPFADGKPDREKWLKGATLPFQPIGEMKAWHKTAPDITPSGRLWQRWGENGLVKFLTAGVNPNNGRPADPPMPSYRLKQDDAEAIVAYLKTLK